MYLPPAFVETDAATVDALIAAHPLAILVAHTDAGLVANPIPLMRQGDDLIGHVALANDLHRILADGAPVLAVFQGPDAYVSPNWYPSKAATHKAVPTWNYQSVQVHATIHWQHAEKDKRRALSLLTTHFERRSQGEAAWRMGDAPADFMADRLANIVAFRLAVTRVIAKSKLSQNRDPADRDAVEAALETVAPDVARAMRDHSRQ